jgi:hypothetical protein
MLVLTAYKFPICYEKEVLTPPICVTIPLDEITLFLLKDNSGTIFSGFKSLEGPEAYLVNLIIVLD